MSKGPPTLRLDRLLANLGYGSRREVQRLVVLGPGVARWRRAGRQRPAHRRHAGFVGAHDGRRRAARSAARPGADAAQAGRRDLLAQGTGTAGLLAAAGALAAARAGDLDRRPARQGYLGPVAADRRRRAAAQDHFAAQPRHQALRRHARPAAARRRGKNLRLRRIDAGKRRQSRCCRRRWKSFRRRALT